MRASTALAMGSLWALAAGCGSEAPGLPIGGASGGGGGNGASGSSSSMVASNVAATTGSGMGGNVPFDCDPPADPGSLYELSDVAFGTFATTSMCQYRGDVLLIANLAAL